MTLRIDHVSGAFFIGVGLLVIALSGDLPIGSLSSPGAGFMPNILAVLTILFGIVLLIRAKESRICAVANWQTAKYAGIAFLVAGAVALLLVFAGFLITDLLLIVALLLLQRHDLLPADLRHTALVVLLTAAAATVFDRLGFVIADVLLIFALIIIVERKRLLPAATYSIGLVVFTYLLFVYVLKTPLEAGPLGF